jgi:type I restriction enzyme M protein
MVRGELRDRFIETLTELGGSAGNKRLHEALGWAENTYWNVHGALIETGVITAGRGRGGSVALAGAVATPSENNRVRSITPVSSQTPHRSKAEKARNGNGANLGFEAQLFLAADKLRKNLEPSDYKHVALGLIFLKYISIAFEAKRAALLAEDPAAVEDPDEYLAENVFWVPKGARWSYLQANAKQSTIGKLIDVAMAEIEKANPGLKGVLPKDYNRPARLLSRLKRPLSRGSSPSGYPAEPLVSYQINRQLSGWNLPPLMIRAFGAHCQEATFTGTIVNT